MKGRDRPKKPYVEDNKYHMQLYNYCDMKGAALDKRESGCD